MRSDTLMRPAARSVDAATLLFLNFNVKGDLLEAARQCEQDVFLASFGNTREQLDEDGRNYLDRIGNAAARMRARIGCSAPGCRATTSAPVAATSRSAAATSQSSGWTRSATSRIGARRNPAPAK